MFIDIHGYLQADDPVLMFNAANVLSGAADSIAAQPGCIARTRSAHMQIYL